MGLNMWPSTPLSVNNGIKPTMMIAAEKKIARLTSVAARKIVASFPRRPAGAAASAAPLRGAPSPRWRKMFFHHDDGRIDDETEIDGTDREEIGGFSPQDKDGDCKEEGERNGRRDDEGAAQISEKEPLNEKHKNHAEDQVEQDGMGGQADEVAAIVNALDTYPRRENARRVDLVDFRFDAANRGQALLAAPHQDDPLNDVVLLVPAGDSEPRLVSDDDLGDVAEKHGVAACCREHRVADVAHRANEPDPAHDCRLLADIDGVAAHVDVAVVQRLQNLRQRQAIGHEFVAIDLDFERLGLAAPAGHVDDARYGAKAAGNDPILQGLEVHHAVARRSDELIAVDFACRAPRRDHRLRLVLQLRQLAQPIHTKTRRP